MRKKTMKFTLTMQAEVEAKNGKVQLIVKDIKAKPSTIPLRVPAAPSGRKGKAGGGKSQKTIHDIILETARRLSKKSEDAVFTSIDLYKSAIKKYPSLNKKSFTTTVIASAPEHPSWKHYPSGKDHLVYLGKGRYRLREKAAL